METIQLQSWDEFHKLLERIRVKYGVHTCESGNKLTNTVLFRGHADEDWKLRTTLERTIDSVYTLEKYVKQTLRCSNEIESLTGKKWEFPDRAISKKQEFFRLNIPYYGYLVYLRHNGFPSPLLDWTTSPYIAAYFAFEQKNDAEYCSIYVFIETPKGMKYSNAKHTVIHTHGPYVTTHTRHFAQKAWYTTATKWNMKSKEHTFCYHDSIPSKNVVYEQDVLIKISIPRQERLKVLKHLEDYNINHYTLFQSEDALAKTMGVRIFELDNCC